jgi:ABC-type polysaccharide/polyol phosphate transport system ATPase subunit
VAASNIVSFEEAYRAREDEGPRVIDIGELATRQSVVAFADCHAAFDNVTLIEKTKAIRTVHFSDLSVAFPKGRRTVILGHPGSGLEVLIDLLLRWRAPTRGQVHINSSLSWPANGKADLASKLSVRANALFAADVMGLSGRRFLATVQRFCELTPRQMRERTSRLPVHIQRRLSFAMLIAADFDCHIFSGLFRGSQLGFKGEDSDRVEAIAYGRDLIITVQNAKHVPDVCDLAYLLYEGRLYMFEDVDEAGRVFSALPVPPHPFVQKTAADDDEGDDSRDEMWM